VIFLQNLDILATELLVIGYFTRGSRKSNLRYYFTAVKMAVKKEDSPRLTVNMRVAISLLEVFLISVIAALIVTVETGPLSVKLLASTLVSPIIILSIAFIHFCGKRKIWSFAGATVLGIVGVLLRVTISTQQSLEVGGGLPVGITVVYIVLGSLVSLKSYESVLELKRGL
jgi:hypothetical protein